MNEVEFRNWLSKRNVSKKVQSDYISRIKKIEKELDLYDIDEQYHTDRCKYLMDLFLKRGINDEMKKYPNTNLPIGKCSMNTLRHSINKYVQFCDEVLISNSR